MKVNLKCTFYKLLFRLAPLDAWKVFVMDRHFSKCSRCGEESLSSEEVKELPVSLQEAEELPRLWPRLRGKLGKTDTYSKRKWQWVYATAAAAALLLLVFLLPFSKKNQGVNGYGTGPGDVEETEQVKVRSVKIGSKAARYYVFHSNNPDKLIVWAQARKNEKN